MSSEPLLIEGIVAGPVLKGVLVVAMAPFGLPSGLYTTPTLSMSALATVSRQEQQQPAVYSPAESTLKQKFMQALPVTAYAPAEGGIKMYSRVSYSCRELR